MYQRLAAMTSSSKLVMHFLRLKVLMPLFFLNAPVLLSQERTATKSIFAGQQLGIGFKGGVNYTSLKDTPSESKYTLGYHAGLSLPIGLLRRLELEFNFMYYTAGFVSTGRLQGSSLELKNELSYLGGPVVLKYFPGIGINLQLGGYASYLLIANTKGLGGLLKVEGSTLDYFNRWDWGAVYGVGWEISYFTMEARYLMGIARLQRKNYSLGGFAKHNIFIFSLGLVFPLMEW